MNLTARIGKIEAASPPTGFVRIEATDEADLKEQYLKLLFSGMRNPRPVDLEIPMSGRIKREMVSFLAFEEMLELLD